jgi:hypothetical protein
MAGWVIGGSLLFGGQAGAQSTMSDLALLTIQQSDLPSGYQPDTSGTTWADTSACDHGNSLLMEADSGTQGQAGSVETPDTAWSAIYTLPPYDVASGVLEAQSISEASEVVNLMSSRSYAQCGANASVTNGVVTDIGGGQASYGDQSTQFFFLAHDSSSTTFVGDFTTVARVGFYVVVLEDGAVADSASAVSDGVGQQTRNQLMQLLLSQVKSQAQTGNNGPSVPQGQQPQSPPTAATLAHTSSTPGMDGTTLALSAVGVLMACLGAVLLFAAGPVTWMTILGWSTIGGSLLGIGLGGMHATGNL